MTTGARRHEAPFSKSCDGGLVEHFVAGAGIDLDRFGSALIIDKHAQEHPAFFAIAAGAIGVMGLRRFAIAGLDKWRSSLSHS